MRRPKPVLGRSAKGEKNKCINNRQLIIGTADYLTLQTRCRINPCRYNRVRLYVLVDSLNYQAQYQLIIYTHTHTHMPYMFQHILTSIIRYRIYNKFFHSTNVCSVSTVFLINQSKQCSSWYCGCLFYQGYVCFIDYHVYAHVWTFSDMFLS